MSTKLVLLGTAGGPTPQGERHAPSQVVVVDDAAYVIDCGNGVADQLARAGVPFSAIRAVFVTHQHSDHNADLGNLLLLGWSALRPPVRVYAPPPATSMFGHFLELNRYDIGIRVEDEGRVPLGELVEVHEITAGGVVYEDDRVRVTGALVEHPPVEPAFAFRVDTPDRSIVVSGDTRPADSLVALAEGADVLVHETMHVPGLGNITERHNGQWLLSHLLASHTRSDEVGAVAARADVGTLVLSHFTPAVGVAEDVWAAEARKGFDGPVVVGRDLLEV